MARSSAARGVDSVWTESLLAQTRETFTSGAVLVPALPWAAAGLLSVGAPPPLPWLINALVSDDVLASAVLRIANSPSYQPRCPLLSVAAAAHRLGAEALGEMALAAAVQAHLFELEGFENELRSFWRQALAAAVFAKDLGRACGVDPSTGFACGLLHEIGHPFALWQAARICRQNDVDPTWSGVRCSVLEVGQKLAPLAADQIISAWSLRPHLARSIVSHSPMFRVTDSPHATVAHMATQMAASLYRRESPWEPALEDARLSRAAVNDATAAGLPQLGNSVRTWVDSLTV